MLVAEKLLWEPLYMDIINLPKSSPWLSWVHRLLWSFNGVFYDGMAQWNNVRMDGISWFAHHSIICQALAPEPSSRMVLLTSTQSSIAL